MTNILDKEVRKIFDKATKINKDKWTYIRILKTTASKLKLLKIKRNDLIYDLTLNYLLSKEKLEFK